MAPEPEPRPGGGDVVGGAFAFCLEKHGQLQVVLPVPGGEGGAERKEEALRNAEGRSTAISKAIPDMVFRLDRQGVFLDYKADENDLFTQSENIIGKRNRDITPPEFADWSR